MSHQFVHTAITAADVVRGIIRIFEAKTMTQHRQVGPGLEAVGLR